MCECYKIGGPFIDVDPDCPIHNKNHRNYQEDQPDVIEQLQAKVAELEAENAKLHEQVDLQVPKMAFTQLKDQLAKAEQRVAEACALQVATEIKFHWLDAARVAKEIRSGEWRKFVKEEV